MSIGPMSLSIRSTSASTCGGIDDIEDRPFGGEVEVCQRGDRARHLVNRSAIHDDGRAVFGKALGQRLAYALRRPGDERKPAGEVEQARHGRLATRA